MNQSSFLVSNNLAEVEIAIREAISSSGLYSPGNISLDGSIHRFDGKKARGANKDCWYVGYFSPIPVVIFGDWKSGFRSKYVHVTKQLCNIESRRLKAHLRELKVQSERQQADVHRIAALRANIEWRDSTPVQKHDYLDTKQIPAYRLRANKNNVLLVPVTDGNRIQSLQYIRSDGSKKFLQGGKIKSHYYPIGITEYPIKILICEGIATGLTLYEDTQLPIIVAFNAANLAPVAKITREKYPDSRILICGDNDHATEGNPGKAKAIEAAALCDGDWVVPDFTGLTSGSKDTDFNDLKRLRGAFCE